MQVKHCPVVPPSTPDGSPSARRDDRDPLERLLLPAGRAERVTHVERIPAQAARTALWPQWVPDLVVTRLQGAGIEEPWTHQVEAAEAPWAGRSVVVATGTASGKSLGYLLPVLSALVDGAEHPSGRGATALYLAPTKALGHDQLRAIRALALTQVRAATYDGDTPSEEREWVRAHASLVVTNPDMLHRGVLPRHSAWASFLRRLRFVVIDEAHHYRGVFGSHVACVVRRLRRVCERYGTEPVFILASATVSAPGESAQRLTGLS